MLRRSSIIIQTRYRGYTTRKSERLHEKLAAVRSIQRYARGYLSRLRVDKLRKVLKEAVMSKEKEERIQRERLALENKAAEDRLRLETKQREQEAAVKKKVLHSVAS